MAKKFNPNECASCKRAVGVSVGYAPFRVTDARGGDDEVFCAQCFVYVRSPREPFRFTPGCYVPVKCGACSCVGVAVGQDACPMCASRSVILLPPEPGVC